MKKGQAMRLAIEAVIAFALIVLTVAKFETTLLAVNWRLVALISGVLVIAAAFYHLQAQPNNTYDVIDLVTTGGRADLWKHLVVFFAFLSAWAIVQQALADKPIETLLISVLGVFVGKVAVDSISNAIAGRITPADKPDVAQAPAAASYHGD